MNIFDRTLFNMLHAFCFFHGYRIRVAETDDDIRTHDAFVKSCFVELGYFRNHQTEIKKTTLDSSTHLLMADYRGTAVGTVRLIQYPATLPVELFFEFQLPPTVDRPELAEIGRFVVAPSHRQNKRMLTYELLSHAVHFSWQHSIRWWIGCAPSPLVLGFRPLFGKLQLLEQLPLRPDQIDYRKGREHYFEPSNSVCLFLVDLRGLSIARAAREVLRRSRRRRRRNTGKTQK